VGCRRDVVTKVGSRIRDRTGPLRRDPWPTAQWRPTWATFWTTARIAAALFG